MDQSIEVPVYRRWGYCPICEREQEFVARFDWYRDHLRCTGCGSIPRERAVALEIARRLPSWRQLDIHETSPGVGGISAKLERECKGYVKTYFLGDALGSHEATGNLRNENLESQSFGDEQFDLVVSLDVMEHVNLPETAFREVARTLKPGGQYIFTAPTYKELLKTERRALYQTDSSVTHYAEPEYHANPIDAKGSLVTFHFGYDLPEIIHAASGMDVEVVRFHDHTHGILGEFTEVYIATKPIVEDQESRPSDANRGLRAACEAVAAEIGVRAEVHDEDFIFHFIVNNPVFASKKEAVAYYFVDGANSANKVRRLIDRWANKGTSPLTILEFAAGYGAVTRHATKSLEPHILHSCDIHPQANAFLADVLGVRAVASNQVPEDLVLPTRYDAVFALSFFSHMPNSTWRRWLMRLYGALKPGGILIFTTHGITSMAHFPHATLDQSGFWFEAASEQHDLDTSSYGQTITAKEFVEARIAELPGVEYLLREAAGWWAHQDLYIVRRTI